MSIIQKINSFYQKMGSMVSVQDIMMLWLRLWIAGIFYKSGRTKAGEGFLELNSFTPDLFEYEHPVPGLDAETAAQLALYGETILPLMLVVGLASRFAAAGLLVMTIVIQMVMPQLWPDHIVWAAALLGIIMVGPGKVALDSVVSKSVA